MKALAAEELRQLLASKTFKIVAAFVAASTEEFVRGKLDGSNSVAWQAWASGLAVAAALLALRHTFAGIEAKLDLGIVNKAAVLLLAVGLMAGCHSLSSATLDEAHAAEAVGENTLNKWPTLTDDQKKQAVTSLTRASASILVDADGTPLPARFAVVPAPAGVK